jgi:hypothetical protein
MNYDSMLKAKERQSQAEMFSHFYLQDAALCLQCQSVFRIVDACPACGSTTVWPLEHWVPKAESACVLGDE